MIGLTWLEPGEDLAERLVNALQAAAEERAGQPAAPSRVDLDLAGHAVMHFTMPVLMPEPVDPESLAVGDDEELSPEKADKLREQFQQKLKDRKLIEADRSHVFVARLGGRLLFANTFSQSAAEMMAKDEEARSAIDWDELTGAEQVTGVFARFLAAHDGQGEGGAAQLLAVPGVAAALPDGTPLVEVIGDPRPLMKLAGAAAEGRAAKLLKTLGVEALGPLALRIALDGNALRSGVFLSAPEPRSGLLSLLDQKPLAPELPEWVPAGVLEYQQISFDLGEAYNKIKELAIAEGGDSMRQTFAQVEGAVQATLQTDLATLLSSLGQRHIGITFPPKNESQPAGEADAAHAALPAFNQRIGLVWQVKDEQVWNRVMQVIGQFAPASGGAVQSAEEQGFKGFRVQQGPVETGLFLGRGYLVLGVGADVTESLLSVLRTPPTGEAALRASGLVERGNALLPSEPCLIYQIGDAGISVKATKRMIEQFIDMPLSQPQLPGAPFGPAAEQKPDAEKKKALAAKLKALLPSDSELEGVMGVSVDQAAATPHGLLMRSAIELPAP